MTPILIYERVLELEDNSYHVCHYPGTLEQLTLAHPNHQIYLYEPPIVTTPVLVEGEAPIETPTVYPETWTPVDPVVAICIPITTP
jgi:hypothetical protein